MNFMTESRASIYTRWWALASHFTLSQRNVQYTPSFNSSKMLTILFVIISRKSVVKFRSNIMNHILIHHCLFRSSFEDNRTWIKLVLVASFLAACSCWSRSWWKLWRRWGRGSWTQSQRWARRRRARDTDTGAPWSCSMTVGQCSLL